VEGKEEVVRTWDTEMEMPWSLSEIRDPGSN